MIVLWSGLAAAVVSALVVCASAAVIAAALLLLGFSRSDLVWKLALGTSAISMAFVPLAVLWLRRRAPFYPLDAVALVVIPLATPFLTSRLLHFAFHRVWRISVDRVADAILVVVGCAFILFASWSVASVFLQYVSLPRKKTI